MTNFVNSCRWVAFTLSDALSKTIVHFFPASDGAVIPYPADCKLSIMSPEFGKRSVILEGGRLGQPDGVRLEDAFPEEIVEGGGVLGIEVEVSTAQPKIDLSPSQCIVEISMAGKSVRFNAKRVLPGEESTHYKDGVVFHDGASMTSLIAINTGLTEVMQNFEHVASATEQATSEKVGWQVKVAPDQAVELGITSPTVKERTQLGSFEQSASAVKTEHLPATLTCYLLHRDAITRQPQAVSAL